MVLPGNHPGTRLFFFFCFQSHPLCGLLANCREQGHISAPTHRSPCTLWRCKWAPGWRRQRGGPGAGAAGSSSCWPQSGRLPQTLCPFSDSWWPLSCRCCKHLETGRRRRHQRHAGEIGWMIRAGDWVKFQLNLNLRLVRFVLGAAQTCTSLWLFGHNIQ